MLRDFAVVLCMCHNTFAWLDFIVWVLVCINNCDGSWVTSDGSWVTVLMGQWVTALDPLPALPTTVVPHVDKSQHTRDCWFDVAHFVDKKRRERVAESRILCRFAWFSTRFAARFSTSSCGFATRFRPAFDFFCRKPDREPQQIRWFVRVLHKWNVEKNPFEASSQLAFDILSTCLRQGFRPGLQLARIRSAVFTNQVRDVLVSCQTGNRHAATRPDNSRNSNLRDRSPSRTNTPDNPVQ